MSESAEAVLVWLLIENDNKVLITKRKPDEPPFAGAWTLPGDVLAKGEAPSYLIARYARDELDVQIMGDEPFETLRLSDGSEEYAISVYRVGFEGTPRFRESGPFTEVGWAPRSELMDKNAFPMLAELAASLPEGG
jgi:ADP-ribose pyrophosphatase YjhB (NUDIX family)